MILQNPLGLLSLLVIPLLVLLKLWQARPRVMVVPSLFIWKKITEDTAKTRPSRGFKLFLILIIQIIALALLALALSNPAFIYHKTILPETIIVLDNSVGMTSLTSEGRTRWEVTTNRLKQWLNRQSPELPIVFILPAGTSADTVSRYSPHELVAYLDKLTPLEITVDWSEWLIKFSPLLDRMIESDQTKPSFYFYSDRFLPEAIANKLKIKPVYVLSGSPSRNLGITHLAAGNGKDKLSVLVSVCNFTDEAQSIPIQIYFDGNLQAEQIVNTSSQGEQTTVLPVKFSLKPQVIEARLSKQDDLPCDNRAFLTLLDGRKTKVHLAGRANKYVNKVLNANPLVELTYSAELPDLLENYDIIICNKITPTKKSLNGKMVILNPPSAWSDFAVKTPISNSRITYTDIKSPLFAEVNPAGFHIWHSAAIEITDEDKKYFNPLLKSGEDIIMGEYRKDNMQIIITGFDMDWRGLDQSDTDWAQSVYFPIFWTNLINYLVPSGGEKEYGYYKTGSYIKGLDSILEKTGLYGNIAVNLCDKSGSDNNGSTQIPPIMNSSVTGYHTREIIQPFSFWLALMALCLLIISWWWEGKQD